MIHETTTSLGAAAIIQQAKKFFAERVPQYAAYPEKEGASYLTLRGQGGEEIAIAVIAGPSGNRVRASTLLFDQGLGRFLSTLPEVA